MRDVLSRLAKVEEQLKTEKKERNKVEQDVSAGLGVIDDSSSEKLGRAEFYRTR